MSLSSMSLRRIISAKFKLFLPALSISRALPLDFTHRNSSFTAIRTSDRVLDSLEEIAKFGDPYNF